MSNSNKKKFKKHRKQMQNEMRMDMQKRRKEYNRKIRHYPLDEETSANELKVLKNAFYWDTVS